MSCLVLAEGPPGARAKGSINGTSVEPILFQPPLHLTELGCALCRPELDCSLYLPGLGRSLCQPDNGNVVEGDFVSVLKVAQVHGPSKTDAPRYAGEFARAGFSQNVIRQRRRDRPCDVGYPSSAVSDWLDRGALSRDDRALWEVEERGRSERHTAINRVDIRQTACRGADDSVVYDVHEICIETIPLRGPGLWNCGNRAGRADGLPFQLDDERLVILGRQGTGDGEQTRNNNNSMSMLILLLIL